MPKTGVIYVMDEASKAGYCAATAQEWAIHSDCLHFLGYDFIWFPELLVWQALASRALLIGSIQLNFQMVLMIDFAFSIREIH